MGSLSGATKTAAIRLGMTIDEYLEKRAAGQKWCSGCKSWHPTQDFPRNRNRSDGLNAECLVAKLGKRKSPRHRPQASARTAVYRAIRKGILPLPSSLPCTDCGHHDSDKRHEYDHFAGYNLENRLSVEVVCTTCHADREIRRRGAAECQDENSKDRITG